MFDVLLHSHDLCVLVWFRESQIFFSVFLLLVASTRMRRENAVMQRWCGRQSHSSRKPRLHLHSLQHAKELRFSWLCAAFITSDVVDRYFCGFLAFPHFLILYSLRLLLYFLRSLTPSSHYDSLFCGRKTQPTGCVSQSCVFEPCVSLNISFHSMKIKFER